MQSKPEKEIQSKILKALRKIDGCVAWPHVASPYSPTGHSDTYGTIRGYGWWGEVKVPGKEVTAIQRAFLSQVGREVMWNNTFVWTSVKQAVKDIKDLESDICTGVF